MPSTYTTDLGIEKIATGEQDGTWGNTTNTNWELMDQSIVGQVDVTLTITGTTAGENTVEVDTTTGALSDGRNMYINFIDGADLGGTAYVQFGPNNAKKIAYIANNLSGSRDLVIWQGTYNGTRDYVLANGRSAILKFDGQGAPSSTVESLYATAQLDNADVIGALTAGTISSDDTITATGNISGLNLSGSNTGDGPDWTAGTEAGFHSLGIDDNATGKRVQVADLATIFGDGSAAETYHVGLNYTTAAGASYLSIGGEQDTTSGAYLKLNCGTAGTSQNDIEFGAVNSPELLYDHSLSDWNFQANSITTTGAIIGASYGGVLHANIVDKIAAETISGVWDFTANSTALTQTASDNSTKIATTAYVDAAASPATVVWDKSITIESPESGNDITWFFTNRAITATEIRFVAVGTTPSTVFTVKHDPSRSAAGATVVSQTVTNTTTGHDITAFTDATIPADSFVWVEIGTTTGTVTTVSATIIGTVD